MSGSQFRRRAGTGWLVLIALPPLLVVAGLVLVLVWWGSRADHAQMEKSSESTNSAAAVMKTR
jgi:hypothetical protein